MGSSLFSCRTSTLCSFPLGYNTLWRQVCWESLTTLPSCHGCTRVWIDPARYCFRVRKSIWILRLLFCSEWNKKPDSLLLHISVCWKNDQVSRSRSFRWEFPLRNWILCLALSSSESTKKCWQERNSSLNLWSSTSPTKCSTSACFVPDPICIPCWVFLCWR